MENEPYTEINRIFWELAITSGKNVPFRHALTHLLDVIGQYFDLLCGRVMWPEGSEIGGESSIFWSAEPNNPLSNETNLSNNDKLVALINSGQPLIIEDVLASEFRDEYFYLSSAGIRGYIALPIYVDSTLTAIMELFGTQPIDLTPNQIDLLNQCVTIIGQIIERELVHVRLRESERRFRGLFDNSYQFIALLETDGKIIDINATALSLFGIELNQVQGENLWLTPWWRALPQSQDELRQAIEKASAGQFIRYDTTIQDAGAQNFSYDFSIKPIRNRAGSIILLILEGRDITEFQRTLGQLQRAELKLEEAQRIAQIGHWEYTLSDNESSFSDTLLEIFAFNPETAPASPEGLMERIHPSDITGIQRLLFRSFYEVSTFEHHFRIVRPNGEVRWVFMAGRGVADEHGQPVRIAGIVQDVSGRRKLESSLAHSVERLSGLNQMGQTVASMIDLPTIYRHILSTGRKLLNADAVILFTHEGDELFVSAVDERDGLGLLGHRIPDHAGIAGEVWQNKESIWLSGEDCRRRRSTALVNSSGYDPNTIIAVPVLLADEIIGVLEATNINENAFEADDFNMLQAIANWTAIAIGKAQQHNALERRLIESEAIASVSKALGETLELQEILEMIVSTAHQLVARSDWAVIHLLRGRPEQLEPAAVAGTDADLTDYVIGPEEGIAGISLQEGRVINAGNTETDPRASYYAHTVGLHSLLVAPILARNKRIGTITLHCTEPNAFTLEDERLLTILAAQAGLSIENAYLFDSQRRARSVAELQRERLRHLAGRIVTAQEEERLRISRELHDDAGQSLTSLKISLDLMRQSLPPGLDALRNRLIDLATLTGDTMESLRTLAHDLRPPGLDAFGLNVALDGLCQDFSARTGMSVDYKSVDLSELPTVISLPLYRLTQEALSNIAKHAEAGRVSVELSRSDGKIQLSIMDDGKGFIYEPDSRHQSGIGLISMQERTDLIGGTLGIETAPGEGTRIIVIIPEIIQGTEQTGIKR